MSMLINTISAIGNNTSIYPLLVRDCGIEAPTKVVQTYNQNAKESKIMAKHATRERIIDEYGASAVWLGGIPLVEKICNKFIDKKGFSSKISCKLFDFVNTKDGIQQSLDINIDKFQKNKNIDVINAVNDLKKVKSNKNLFRSLTAAKYSLAIAVPTALMGFVLPKSNFALTKILMNKDVNKGLIPEKYINQKKLKDSNITNNAINYNNLITINNNGQNTSFNSFKSKNNITFKGYSSFMTGLTQQQKMAITDGGLGVGRITTSRKRNEGMENALRASGMLYLNFVAPKQIDKKLNKVINKVFGINPELDPKIMANKRFLVSINKGELDLPKSQDNVIDFIDNNPKSLFSKIAAEQGEVKFLKSGYRDPRCYVNTEKVFNLAQKMNNFAQDAKKSGNIKSYAQKAILAKSTSIAANIVISSALLAVGLPQLQFAFRKMFFKSDVDPGLV